MKTGRNVIDCDGSLFQEGDCGLVWRGANVKKIAFCPLHEAAPDQNKVLVDLAEEFADRLQMGIGCDPGDLNRYLKTMRPIISKASSPAGGVGGEI